KKIKMLLKFNIILYIIIFLNISMVYSLTAEERSELQRKMKYYHTSVRPGERFNMISTINGTFFDIPTEIRIMNIYLEEKKIYIDLTLILNYYDERLQMKELKQNIKIPNEFKLWSPTLYIDGSLLNDYNSFLDPANGYVSLIYKIKYGKGNCMNPSWKYPFEKYICPIVIETENDEHLSLKFDRDMRSIINEFTYIANEWPFLKIDITIKSFWQSTIAIIYLPSILLFSVSLFSQFKRRKVQVQILTSAIICIIFLESTKYISNSFRFILTMQDVWLLGTFIHLISLLSLDLLLPSQHIYYDIEEENDNKINQKNRNNFNSKNRNNLIIHDEMEGQMYSINDKNNIKFGTSILKKDSKLQGNQINNYENVGKNLPKLRNGSCYNNLSYEGSPSIQKNNLHPEAYPLIIANNSQTKYQGIRKNSQIDTLFPVNRRGMIIDMKGQSSIIEINDDTNKKEEKRKRQIFVNEPNHFSPYNMVKFHNHQPQTISSKPYSIIYTLSEKKKIGVLMVLCVYVAFALIYFIIVIGILQWY
uniref:Neurotransmitter-gated ion-channel ligand-binding domain-containing protein n=2 Tax=Strongyloides stercoralis TaxID=6248 RepID=A0AAF5DQ16_STRER